MSETLPDWLQPYWQRLMETRQQGRFPHALLITGRAGIGKRMLADALAATLLCEAPGPRGEPCGQCAACAWLQAHTHPDLIGVEPEEQGKAIKVDQVRALSRELGMTSHGGRYKVAIIDPAEAMNVNAANSLLKTLEEPTADTLLILLSAKPGQLPATVRSRCQQLAVASPSLAAARPWLEANGLAHVVIPELWTALRGAPLKVRAAADSDLPGALTACLDTLAAVFAGSADPLRVAAEWSGGDIAAQAQWLDWWRQWLEDLIRWRQASQPPASEKVVQKLQTVAETVDCSFMFELHDRIDRALIELGSGLNRQLLFEGLLIDWASLNAQQQRRQSRQATSKR